MTKEPPIEKSLESVTVGQIIEWLETQTVAYLHNPLSASEKRLIHDTLVALKAVSESPARSEISVKSVFGDEDNLKAQIGAERLSEIEIHAYEGHRFGDSTNSVILELVSHIRAVEKVRDEWCMKYVRLRDTPEPVSVDLDKCAKALAQRNGYELSAHSIGTVDRFVDDAKAVLDAAGVKYVE